MGIEKIVTKIIDRVVNNVSADGSFPSGHNGPYRDPETPVRTTAHWLIALINMISQNYNERWHETAQKAYHYLLTTEHYTKGYYHCRRDSNKDLTNGLIGQAWVIEALIEGSEYFHDDKGRERALHLYKKHKFDKKQGLWHRIGMTGSPGRIDQTFNHQLWFAACSAPLKTYYPEYVNQDVSRFIDRLKQIVYVLPEGLIWHEIPYKADLRSRLGHFKNKTRFLFKALTNNSVMEQQKINEITRLFLKSVGYHAFNLYAFVRLMEQYPDEAFWSNDIFFKAVNYLNTDEYKNLLKGENTYGYPYNAPGFEVPFIKYKLKELDYNGELKKDNFLGEQISRTYNDSTHQFDMDNPDPATLTARIYELSRVPLHFLKQIEI